MGIPLLRGGFFTLDDTIQSPCVIVIDSVLARTYFATSDPVGQTMSAGFSPVGPCRIVGVVGHVNQWHMDEARTSPQNQAYFPLYQDPDKWVPLNYPYTSSCSDATRHSDAYARDQGSRLRGEQRPARL
jgi:putative ABC transport system permease protein